MQTIIHAFLFFLPAGIANMVPIFVAKMPVLKNYNQPLDFGLKFKGKRILGDHKTIRGLLSGIIVGTFFAIILNLVFPKLYINSVAVGFLLSFGALLGDSIKSFFKRRIGIQSGKTWFPFDQTDYILGGLLFSAIIIRLTFLEYIIIFILYSVLHLVTTTVGYLLRLKESAI